MTIEVLMVDVDGVIIHAPDGRRWDADIERDLGVDPKLLQESLFGPFWREVVHGRADLRARVGEVLARIAPAVTPDRFIAYWFAKDARLNGALLADLAALRAAGVALHLATDQEHLRAAYLWTRLDLRSRFDAIHYAAELGVGKPDPGFFAEIARRSGFPAPATGFIDDKGENIEAGRAAGWRGHVWTPGSTLAAALAAMGHPPLLTGQLKGQNP